MKFSTSAARHRINLRTVNRTFALAVAAALALAPSLTAAAVYSAGGDLEANLAGSPSNPNGPWQYGESPVATSGSQFILQPHLENAGSTFQGWDDPSLLGPLTDVNITNVPQNGGALNVAPGEAVLHPGPTNDANGAYAVFRFTAPANALYSIDATFRPVNTGSDDVHVVVNGTSVYDQFFSNLGPANGHYAGQFALTSGSTIEFTEGGFTVGGTRTYNSNLLGLVATITQTPEPSSVALLSLAAAGLLVAARRRKA